MGFYKVIANYKLFLVHLVYNKKEREGAYRANMTNYTRLSLMYSIASDIWFGILLNRKHQGVVPKCTNVCTYSTLKRLLVLKCSVNLKLCVEATCSPSISQSVRGLNHFSFENCRFFTAVEHAEIAVFVVHWCVGVLT